VNVEQLVELAKNAAQWAKTYVVLKEALVAEGVREEEAREEARSAANMAAFYDPEAVGEDGHCPLCGE